MSNTLFIGKVYHRFDELPSTSDWALEQIAASFERDKAAKNKPPEGTVVRADRQSAGRGQFGSRWESEADKNLTLSVILYPTWLEAPAQFYLSMAAALALRDAINDKWRMANDAAAITPTTIKWPNDLYLGSGKTAGILIQNTIAGHFLQTSVVGIGLNVNQMEFSAALPNPTSLALFFGKKFDLDELAEKLFWHLERRYLQLKSGRRDEIKVEYERAMFRLGALAKFVRTADDSEFVGTIRGATEEGRLRIAVDGEERTFGLKEIRFEV